MFNKLKIIILLFILQMLIPIAKADDIATNFMLINNYDLPEYSDIWERMRKGFRLSHQEDSKVKYYERLYTKNPASFNRLINNAKPYLYYILTQTEKNGLPSEISLIPAIESSFNPRAQNPTDAYAGMWQFVPSTGRQFSLQQNNDFDDRRNIVKSTLAAIKHLNYLYAMFKQWDVAIGAYNWGEGSMYRAILSSNQKIGNIDYSTLPLREITANYVPKIIALANIIENPRKFGVSLDSVPNQPYFAITSITSTSSINDLYKIANIDKATFVSLNPQFKNNNYKLHLQEQIALPLKNQNIYYASANSNNPINTGVNNNSNIVNVSMSTDNASTSNDTDSSATHDELMNTVYQIDSQSNTENTPQSLNKTNEDVTQQPDTQIAQNDELENIIANKPSPTRLILEKHASAHTIKVDHEISSNANMNTSLDNLIDTLNQK